jgi:hypothetical protein
MRCSQFEIEVGEDVLRAPGVNLQCRNQGTMALLTLLYRMTLLERAIHMLMITPGWSFLTCSCARKPNLNVDLDGKTTAFLTVLVGAARGWVAGIGSAAGSSLGWPVRSSTASPVNVGAFFRAERDEGTHSRKGRPAGRALYPGRPWRWRTAVDRQRDASGARDTQHRLFWTGERGCVLRIDTCAKTSSDCLEPVLGEAAGPDWSRFTTSPVFLYRHGVRSFLFLHQLTTFTVAPLPASAPHPSLRPRWQDPWPQTATRANDAVLQQPSA